MIATHDTGASSKSGEVWACSIVGFVNSFGVFLHFFDFHVGSDFFKLNPARDM